MEIHIYVAVDEFAFINGKKQISLPAGTYEFNILKATNVDIANIVITEIKTTKCREKIAEIKWKNF